MQGTSNVICAHQLGAGEVKDYTIDVSAEVTDDAGTVVDSISSVDWSIDPDDGNLSFQNPFTFPTVNPTQVGIWLYDVEPATYHRVKARVSTGQGRIFDAVIGIGGIEK